MVPASPSFSSFVAACVMLCCPVCLVERTFTAAWGYILAVNIRSRPLCLAPQTNLVGYPFPMVLLSSAQVGFDITSASLVNPKVQPPPEPLESSDAEIEESPVGFIAPWPGPYFKVESFLPGSVYLWACGEPFQGGSISRVSRCQAAAAWIILISQAVSYAGLWYVSGNHPASDSQIENESETTADYSILAVAGAMYLILSIAAADVWCGCALIVEGRGPGFILFTQRRMFGVLLLATFLTLVGSSIRVLFYSAEEDVQLVLGAAAVLFIADVDEKAMAVLKNMSDERALFWVLETIGLSAALAVFAVKVTGNTDAVDDHDEEHRCKPWTGGGCYIFSWHFVLAELPTTVTVFAFVLTSVFSRPTTSFAGRVLFPRSRQWFAITLCMLFWLALDLLWLVHRKALIWCQTVSGGCALVFVISCYWRELACANVSHKWRKGVPHGGRRLLYCVTLLLLLRMVMEVLFLSISSEDKQVFDPTFYDIFNIADFALAALLLTINVWFVNGLRLANLRSADSDSNVAPISFLRPMLIGWGLSEGLFAIHGWVLLYILELADTYPKLTIGVIYATQLFLETCFIIAGAALWGGAAGARGVGYWTVISWLRWTVVRGVTGWVFAGMDKTVK